MKNVTPRPQGSPPPIDPHKIAHGSYLEGRLDAQLEAAEKAHWCERGYRIDAVTGKLHEIERVRA